MFWLGQFVARFGSFAALADIRFDFFVFCIGIISVALAAHAGILHLATGAIVSFFAACIAVSLEIAASL